MNKITPLDLNPRTITPSTFQSLLSAYPATVHSKTRSKALAKTVLKVKKKVADRKKRRADAERKEKSGSGNGKDREGDEEELTSDQKNLVRKAVSQFETLDAWRYEGLPGRLQERKGEKEGEDGYFSKEEVVKLMEWKLQHGINRPTLMSMVRSNQEKAVRSSTSAAFSVLSSSSSFSSSSAEQSGGPKTEEEEEDQAASKDEFYAVQNSLSKLTTPLRGVGPATASLLLSVYSPQIPFYSDDVYLWLCVGVYPSLPEDDNEEAGNEKGDEKKKKPAIRTKELKQNGELIVKYNVPEYKRLWGAVRRLRGRLNRGVEEGNKVSYADVEKVALVIRCLDVSGFEVWEREVEEEAEGEREGEEGGEDRGEDPGEKKNKRRKVKQ